MADSGIVECVAGLMGGGKSFLLVSERIVPYLGAGGCVYTNMDFELEPWHSDRYNKDYKGLKEILRTRFDWELQDGQLNRLPEDLSSMHEHIPMGTVDRPVLVVIDEALDDFDSMDREKNKTSLKVVLTWIRLLRKHNVDIVFIAQEFSELNNRIRTKCSKVLVVNDMRKFVLPELGIPLPWTWGLFRILEYGKGGRTFIKKRYVPKDIQFMGCYRTEQMTRFIKVGTGKTDFRGEGKIDRKKEGVKMWVKIVAMVALVVACALLVGFSRSRDTLETMQEEIIALRGAVASNKVVYVSSSTNGVPEQLNAVRYGIVKDDGVQYVAYDGALVRIGDHLGDVGILRMIGVNSLTVLRDGQAVQLRRVFN